MRPPPSSFAIAIACPVSHELAFGHLRLVGHGDPDTHRELEVDALDDNGSESCCISRSAATNALSTSVIFRMTIANSLPDSRATM